MKNNYDLFEPILALRRVLLQIANLSSYLPSHLLDISRLARKAGRFQIAANAIFELKQHKGLDSQAWKLEESKVACN